MSFAKEFTQSVTSQSPLEVKCAHKAVFHFFHLENYNAKSIKHTDVVKIARNAILFYIGRLQGHALVDQRYVLKPSEEYLYNIENKTKLIQCVRESIKRFQGDPKEKRHLVHYTINQVFDICVNAIKCFKN